MAGPQASTTRERHSREEGRESRGDLCPRRSRGYAPTATTLTRVQELLTRPALELAELVRSGEITAVELAEASFARIDERNPHVKALIALAHDRALATA